MSVIRLHESFLTVYCSSFHSLGIRPVEGSCYTQLALFCVWYDVASFHSVLYAFHTKFTSESTNHELKMGIDYSSYSKPDYSRSAS